jgi:hypothetical protein
MAAPEPTAPGSPSRGRIWRERLRALARRGGAGVRPERARGDGDAAGADAGDQVGGVSTPSAATAGGDRGPDGVAGVSPDGAGAGDAAARPAGVLISADRYDLSDLAES